MAEPLSVLAGLQALGDVIGLGSRTIRKFNDIRAAQEDIAVVSEQYSSLKATVMLIANALDDPRTSQYPHFVIDSIGKIALRCCKSIAEIDNSMKKTRRLGSIHWALVGKAKVRKLQETLTAHAFALQGATGILNYYATQALHGSGPEQCGPRALSELQPKGTVKEVKATKVPLKRLRHKIDKLSPVDRKLLGQYLSAADTYMYLARLKPVVVARKTLPTPDFPPVREPPQGPPKSPWPPGCFPGGGKRRPRGEPIDAPITGTAKPPIGAPKETWVSLNTPDVKSPGSQGQRTVSGSLGHPSGPRVSPAIPYVAIVPTIVPITNMISEPPSQYQTTRTTPREKQLSPTTTLRPRSAQSGSYARFGGRNPAGRVLVDGRPNMRRLPETSRQSLILRGPQRVGVPARSRTTPAVNSARVAGVGISGIKALRDVRLGETMTARSKLRVGEIRNIGRQTGLIRPKRG